MRRYSSLAVRLPPRDSENDSRRRRFQFTQVLLPHLLEICTLFPLLSFSTSIHFLTNLLVNLYLLLQTGKLQQTVANCIERTGPALHSGKLSTVKIVPESARTGRYFVFRSNIVRASIDHAVKETPLCTTLSKDGYTIRTVEHLLSALEATGVDNCRIEIESSDPCDRSVEVICLDLIMQLLYFMNL